MITKKRFLKKNPYRKKSTRTHPKSRVKKRNSRYKKTHKRKRKRRTRKQRSQRGGFSSECDCDCTESDLELSENDIDDINHAHKNSIDEINLNQWTPSEAFKYSRERDDDDYKKLIDSLLRKVKLNSKTKTLNESLDYTVQLMGFGAKAQNEWKRTLIEAYKDKSTCDCECTTSGLPDKPDPTLVLAEKLCRSKNNIIHKTNTEYDAMLSFISHKDLTPILISNESEEKFKNKHTEKSNEYYEECMAIILRKFWMEFFISDKNLDTSLRDFLLMLKQDDEYLYEWRMHMKLRLTQDPSVYIDYLKNSSTS